MARTNNQLRVGSNVPFVLGLSLIGGLYIFLIVAMVVADLAFTSVSDLKNALASREIRYAIKLSLYSCSITAPPPRWSQHQRSLPLSIHFLVISNPRPST